ITIQPKSVFKMRTISGRKAASAATPDCVKSRDGGAITPCEARFPRHLTAKVERQERSSGRNRRGVEGPKHFHTVCRSVRLDSGVVLAVSSGRAAAAVA